MELTIYIHKRLGYLLGSINEIEDHPERDNYKIHRIISADKIICINGTDEAEQVSEIFIEQNTLNQVQKLNIYEKSYVQITNTYNVGPDIIKLWKLEGNITELSIE